MNLEQIIARQEMLDKLWFEIGRLNSRLAQGDYVVGRQKFESFYLSSIKEILEGVVQRTEEDILKLKENWETLSDLDKSIIIIKIESKQDTINYLESIIKKL